MNIERKRHFYYINLSALSVYSSIRITLYDLIYIFVSGICCAFLQSIFLALDFAFTMLAVQKKLLQTYLFSKTSLVSTSVFSRKASSTTRIHEAETLKQQYEAMDEALKSNDLTYFISCLL